MARRRKQRRLGKRKQMMETNNSNNSTESSAVQVPACLTPEEAEAWQAYFSSPEGKVETGTTGGTVGSKTTGAGWSYAKGPVCTHPGDKVVIQLDGINIHCGAKIDLASGYFAFDTILDVGAMIYLAAIPIKDVTGFEHDAKLKLGQHIHRPRMVQLDWPDMGVFPGGVGFWRALWDMFKKNGTHNLLIACQGSHGRTGTALAAIMICCHGYAPAEAATFIRLEHCKQAIETNDQIDYLNNLYAQVKSLNELTLS